MTAATSRRMHSPSSSSPRRIPPAPSPSWLRRIAVVSTSRADSGVYRPLLSALAEESNWKTICLIGGTHHSAQFGSTEESIPHFKGMECVPVEHFAAGDRPVDVARTTGQAVIEFSNALAQHQPDLVFVLGDRTEMLGAALAAIIHKIPIAHLHGGDTTLGAYDEQCRHAMTKLSHLHFPALAEHGKRIEAMGEEPWRVHVVGALALDALRGFKPESTAELYSRVGIDFSQPTIVVVFHPETLSPIPPDRQIDELLTALESLNLNILIVGPNADVGHGVIEDRLRSFSTARANRAYSSSLNQEDFWSCLTHAAALVGNSSAGMIESASFRLPVVNIGRRQDGRVRPENVIDVDFQAQAIHASIEKAIAPTFRSSISKIINPYGDGHTAERILTVLRSLPPRDVLLMKQ